jgi:hypothetical protein
MNGRALRPDPSVERLTLSDATRRRPCPRPRSIPLCRLHESTRSPPSLRRNPPFAPLSSSNDTPIGIPRSVNESVDQFQRPRGLNPLKIYLLCPGHTRILGYSASSIDCVAVGGGWTLQSEAQNSGPHHLNHGLSSATAFRRQSFPDIPLSHKKRIPIPKVCRDYEDLGYGRGS